jgi:hypothetical protein
LVEEEAVAGTLMLVTPPAVLVVQVEAQVQLAPVL